MALRTDADVEKLVAAGGFDQLRDWIASPTKFHPDDRTYARDWLRRQEDLGKVVREDEAHDFMRRQTIAAEESAQAAKTAATWAKMSGLIALAALVATAWPYFKLVDLVERLAK